MLYHPDPFDAVAFALIPAVLIRAALLAGAISAWHAARLDPVAALRAEQVTSGGPK